MTTYQNEEDDINVLVIDIRLQCCVAKPFSFLFSTPKDVGKDIFD